MTEKRRYSPGHNAGSAILGSRYLREYCWHCGDPIRVYAYLFGKEVCCNECTGPPPPAKAGLVARQREGSAKTDS